MKNKFTTLNKNKITVFIFCFVMSGLLLGYYSPALLANATDKLLSEKTKPFGIENKLVDIPESWTKIDSGNDYSSWLTQEGYIENIHNSHGSNGAKFSVYVLENEENLPIRKWLQEHSGNNQAPLISEEDIIVSGMPALRRVFGNVTGSDRGEHTNVYVQLNKKIIGFVVFPFDDNSEHVAIFNRLINSLR